MSASPLKADIRRQPYDVGFGPQPDSCSAAKKLLDYLVGNREQRRALVEAAAITDVDPTAPLSAA
jgi:hypothetical protein